MVPRRKPRDRRKKEAIIEALKWRIKKYVEFDENWQIKSINVDWD